MPKRAYGIDWPDSASELEIDLMAFNKLRNEHVDLPQIFKKVARRLWPWNAKPPRQAFVWHPWADDMLEEACRTKYLALNGSACIAGHTKILNPITGEEPTVQELFENRIAPTVMTLRGPAQAGVPFIKGVDDLYEVVLENGNRFTATAEHRVLTPAGFTTVSSLRPDSIVLLYEPIHSQSTLDTCLSTRGQGVLSSPRKAEGFQESCSVYSCHDGGQLLLDGDSVRSFSPSQVDVQEYMAYAFSDLGGSDNELFGNRLYQYADRLSTDSIFRRDNLPETFLSRPRAQERLSLEHQLFQRREPFQLGTRRQNSFAKPNPCFLNRPSCDYEVYSYRDYTVSPVAVQRIKRIRYGKYYDLSVPGVGHYFAEGAVHHNSCGKTCFEAIWAIVNWLCDPANTCVLVTSTGIKEARQRIWGDIVKYFNSVPGMPGKLLDSVAMIRTDDGSGMRYDSKCGIHVVAGDKSKEKENIQKLIGIHVPRVFLIADELPELSPALYEAAMSNLATAPKFQMIGSGNFKSIYDSFGTFCEPKEGWGSVDSDTERWETKMGVCLHFNGERSPNVLAGEDKWPIYGCRTLEQHRKQPGQHTAGYWRMCISMPSQDAEENTIYPQSAFIKGHAHDSPIWLTTPVPVAALDPAFVTGGDRAMAIFGLFGKEKSGKMVLAINRIVEIREDMRNKRESRPIQVANQFRNLCNDAHVDPANAAYDGSGGGVVFGALLSELWSPKLLSVQFGGAPSELRTSMADQRTGKQSYSNRVTELWFQGLEFVQSEQIRGLPGSVAKELQARRYETNKQGEFLKTRVETKAEMKTRTGGKSPDEGDAFAIMIELCRRRFGFVPGGLGGARTVVKDAWKAKVQRTNRLFDPKGHYQTEELVAV